MKSAQRSVSGILRGESTYKPAQPSTAPGVVAEHIISSPPSRTSASVGSGNQKDQVERDTQRYGPCLLPLIPVVRVKYLGKPEEEVERIQVRFYAVRQRLAPYKPRHTVLHELCRSSCTLESGQSIGKGSENLCGDAALGFFCLVV